MGDNREMPEEELKLTSVSMWEQPQLTTHKHLPQATTHMNFLERARIYSWAHACMRIGERVGAPVALILCAPEASEEHSDYDCTLNCYNRTMFILNWTEENSR